VGEAAGQYVDIGAFAFDGECVAVIDDPSAGRTLAKNLCRDGSFIATSTSGLVTSGESMACPARRTWQLDVPERISGP